MDLQKKDPELLSLVKKVSVSLEKRKLLTDRAKVALCLDISGSMNALYKSGKIDVLVRRVMALGYRFDDDGEIDVFLFGENVHEWGSIGVGDYRSFVSDMLSRAAPNMVAPWRASAPSTAQQPRRSAGVRDVRDRR